MNKGPFGRQCDISKLLAYSSFWRVKRPCGGWGGWVVPLATVFPLNSLCITNCYIWDCSSSWETSRLLLEISSFSLPFTPTLNNE